MHYPTLYTNALYLPLCDSDEARINDVVALLDTTTSVTPETKRRIFADTKRGIAAAFRSTVLDQYPDPIASVDVVGETAWMIRIEFAPSEVIR